MSDRPNVLFFLSDQHRHDWVGFGDDVPVSTPVLDDLASEGVAFRNAVCPSPLCGPSRACLASGFEYDRCGVRDHSVDYPYAASTCWQRLRDEAGYHVLGCGKFDFQKHSGNWSLDGRSGVAAHGFSDGVDSAGKWDCVGSLMDGGDGPDAVGDPVDAYSAYLAEHGLAETHVADFRRRADATHATFPTPLPEHAYCDNWIARQGLELLAGTPDGRPWHLLVNFAGPHNPWDVTASMHGWYRDPDVAFPARVSPGPGDDADVDGTEAVDADHSQAVRRNYAAMVENIDRWLGRYRERLRERGEWEDTVVVFASDHGEMLGDHGQWFKHSPYQPSVGVPLVVAGPGVEARGAVDEPASLLDVHATLLDAAGLSPGDVDSRSLWPYLRGERDDHRDVVYSGIGEWRLAFDGRYKLVRGYDTGRSARAQVADADPWDEGAVTRALQDRDPLLFDLEADPGETENVAAANRRVVERLSARLRTVRGE